MTHIRVLLLRLGIVLLLFTVCRILFYLLNYSYFKEVGLLPFIGGLRFDLSAIFMINSPLIFLSLLPLNVHGQKWHRITIKTLFHSINGLAYGLNIADIEYYPFALKRSTADLFVLMGGGEEDLANIIPSMLAEFWHVLLVLAALIFLAELMYRRIKVPVPKITNGKGYLLRFAIMVAFITISVYTVRGGFQLRPINIISASNYADANHMPLVLNTPFTLIKTMGKVTLEPVDHYTEAELELIYTPYKEENPQGEFQSMNVAIIVLESFSSEYVGCISGQESFTPFLDSLGQHSLVFTNGYANSKKSIEAIPAILSGIPTLMNDPYISSPYSGNKLESIASLLKPKGYYSSFYHGAANGSMGLENFTYLTGFDAYYGMNEYGNSANHDGTWGIYDEEFFQYWASGMETHEEPFVSVFFSVSSHHPYTVPEKYSDHFPKGDYPNMEAVGYTDYALKEFFKEAAQMPWFDNTVFVICADHTCGENSKKYRTSLGTFAIPIIFYTANEGLKAMNSSIAQQIDILPTLLSYLNYDEPYIGFGNNLLDNNPDFSITYLNDVYQLTNDNWLLQFDGEKAIALYDYKKDELLKKNLLETEEDVAEELTGLIKAYIQQYNNRMIENRLIAIE